MPETIAENTVIDEVYTLRRKLGDGGMATVYLADVDLDRFDYHILYAFTQVQGEGQGERRRRAEAFAQEIAGEPLDLGTIRTILKAHRIPLPEATVALKVAKAEMDYDRFTAEWQNLLCLNHPHVVKVYGGGVYEGTPYYAMEVLEDIVPLERIQSEFSLKEKLKVVIQAGKGLAYLHENGIVHRDVKPDNMVTCLVGQSASRPVGQSAADETGRPADRQAVTKITDLGIAKNLDASLALTMTKAIMGTPYYMSPEQVTSSKNVDARTDVYALGASLYQLVAGQPPFHDKTNVYEIIHALSNGGTPISLRDHNPTLPDDLVSIIACAMAPKADERYQSVNELVQDLEVFAWTQNSDLMATTISIAAPNATALDASDQKSHYLFEERQRSARSGGRGASEACRQGVAALSTAAKACALRLTGGAQTLLLPLALRFSQGDAERAHVLSRRLFLSGAGALGLLFVLLIALASRGPEARPETVSPSTVVSTPAPRSQPGPAMVSATTKPAVTPVAPVPAPKPAPVEPGPEMPQPPGPTPYAKALAAAQRQFDVGTADDLDAALLQAAKALRLAKTKAEGAKAKALMDQINAEKKFVASEEAYKKRMAQGTKALRGKQYDEAIRSFNLAVKLQDTEDVRALLLQARTEKMQAEVRAEYARLLGEGRKALADGKPDQALASLHAAAKLQDTREVRRLVATAEAEHNALTRKQEHQRWVRIAERALDKKMPDEAIYALNKAAALDNTTHVQKLRALADAQKRLQAARTSSQPRTIPDQPKVAPAPVKPPARAERRSISEANAVFEAAEHEREIGIRSLLRKHSQYMKAVELYKRVIDTWPQSDKVEDSLYWRGVIFQTLMKYDRAAPEYEYLLKLNPKTTHVDIFYRLGEVYDQHLKDKAKAKRYYVLASQHETVDKFRAMAEKRVQELGQEGY